MAATIEHDFFFPHPPAAVWEYLTSADLMSQWLMKNDFLPILGHDFQFRTNPLPQFGLDGIFYCKILELVPFKKLSYSWRAGPGDGKIDLDSVVHWSLHEKDNGTMLSLRHTGFKELEHVNLYSAMNEGWCANVLKIVDRLNATTHGATNA